MAGKIVRRDADSEQYQPCPRVFTIYADNRPYLSAATYTEQAYCMATATPARPSAPDPTTSSTQTGSTTVTTPSSFTPPEARSHRPNFVGAFLER
ncbi:hypothetical protein MAR_029910 [Mya arenaria]|uniref:Uncharacterized protein n=1 Tax=Mya arenaria TaxID=6604 RepID=A0ABY7DQI9_MYAAR|nr:hypothetical protein MAR_029910 [Mya arenaria]